LYFRGLPVTQHNPLRQNSLCSDNLSRIAKAGEPYFRKSANFVTIQLDLIAYNKMTWSWLAALDLSQAAA
jgi:hypothetical protein